jgi:hypothetical protein
VNITKDQYMDWLEAIQDYYDWSESEYRRNTEKSEAMAKTINEMRMALVMDVEP